MTRRDALDLAAPLTGYQIRVATGTDGAGWYWCFRCREAEWTRRICREPWGLRTADSPLDPDGADWVPGLLEPVGPLPADV